MISRMMSTKGTTTGNRYWRIIATANSWTPSQSYVVQALAAVSFFSSTDCTGIDLCLGKTAFASSITPGQPASFANDNNINTFWVSRNTSGDTTYHWWAIDLEGPLEVKSLKIIPYVNASHVAQSYDVQYSSDGVSWTTKVGISTQPHYPQSMSFTNL
jgi:hypothetical protein